MSKLMMSALAVGLVAAAAVPAVTLPAVAAELPLAAHVRHHHVASRCGPCGCLHVTYDRHRELESTYGIGFDPRSFDTTEPYYFLGRQRAYPQYWVDAELPQ